MNLGIENRVALVTGASRNIGRAIAIELAREGARVITVARSSQDLAALHEELPGAKGQHLSVCLDLQAAGATSQLVDMLSEAFQQPDILVHNLGGSLGVTDLFSPSDEWEKVWYFNVGIAHEINRQFVPAMKTARWGRLLHLSTLATQTHGGNAPYVSAKCALEGYVKTLARELSKHNVMANALAPGLIDLEGRYFSRMRTENPAFIEEYFNHHLPIRRMGSAAEIARVAAFLCSEQAAYMSGAIVRVDGGGS